MIGLQTDMFAMLGEKVETRDEKMFRQALQIGSGFEGGKERIREIIRENERDFGKIC